MPAPGQPLTLRRRPDLLATREIFGDKIYYILKDPLTLKHFRFQEEEYAQWDLLDGRRSLETLKSKLEAHFAPQQFPVETIARFVASLHQAGLVVSDARGQAESLLERRRTTFRKQLLQKLISPTAIQFRGIDPTRFLDALLRPLAWCYSRWALLAGVALILSALTWSAVHAEEIGRRLPTFQEFFTPGNMLLLLALTGGIKILHEIGHGLTCRRFGAECHELGVMFLVFTPCLYCNVSDAWTLPKRRRMAVTAAGIAVELVIAALAVFGWWFSNDGAFQRLCLATIFVSGMSTLVINGNPLMRYDGYFLLSDWVETPNLAEKSAAVLREFLYGLCFGATPQRDPLLPKRGKHWFALYGIASFVYRIAVSFGIYLFLLEWLRPYRLEAAARLFGVVALTTMIVIPLLREFRMAKNRFAFSSTDHVRRRRLAAVAVVIALTAVCFLPLPQRVSGTLEIQPHDAVAVYAEVTGAVVDVDVLPGQYVETGARLAKLENLDLELELAELRGRRAELAADLQVRRLERFHSPSAGQVIAELTKSLAAAEAALDEKQNEHNRLALVAATTGIVLPPPNNSATEQRPAGELPTWSGLPTEERNRTATLEAGTLFCRIGRTDRWEALVVIDQADIELLDAGLPVQLRTEELPDVTFHGTLVEISRRELDVSPTRLSNKSGGELATETVAGGVERPLSATYQARVVVDDPERVLRIGVRGTAKIQVEPATVATRVGRWLARTFHFQI
jgi:putative peptide zinc metalloprotease protein